MAGGCMVPGSLSAAARQARVRGAACRDCYLACVHGALSDQTTRADLLRRGADYGWDHHSRL